ncbi:FAD-dependent monooxygenase [Hydrogenophaga sp.]|uniref:FAD-dependent monooxygenase n=1 Tax=Hydrogenophaga sp. TaxID=1904254 RepID=UPI002731F640|nr:FAD-dependent monooxygenase [Hydrogenophaga sp.]MDP2073237.1 FAD-dependent monooxygenase [Hydrogenophaga sp.]MDP3109303.1 FAD-dependent monooxygenase [Hydrogenophaga sp.]MDZ4396789.1 FAD-dependent monooxygenase [Hydrogenophaga sp.]
MNQQVIVAGGGIGGMACALALARQGVPSVLLEQAVAFGEVGAGLQLGPNATRVLADWGLSDALQACAAFPEALRVRDAHRGKDLGQLRLGSMAIARHGQPYATLHRADLHALLLAAVQEQGLTELRLNTRLGSFTESPDGVVTTLDDGSTLSADALLGCDGLWSRVRAQLLGPQPVRASGHLAYRGMVRTAGLPAALQGNMVTAWLGPRMHVVHYPVRAGAWMNVVAVVHGMLGQGHGGEPGADPQGWTHEARAADLLRSLGPVCKALLDMVTAVPAWSLWALNDRPAMSTAQEHAQGRVALVGDAAHPLRPYLAQGAAMAIEDAWTIGRLLKPAPAPNDWPAVLARFADTRWQRNARVQQHSQRNGRIFHATGLVRFGRDTAMRWLGESLLDNPWLYDGPPEPEQDPIPSPRTKRKT